jgi:hypothetical protein
MIEASFTGGGPAYVQFRERAHVNAFDLVCRRFEVECVEAIIKPGEVVTWRGDLAPFRRFVPYWLAKVAHILGDKYRPLLLLMLFEDWPPHSLDAVELMARPIDPGFGPSTRQDDHSVEALRSVVHTWLARNFLGRYGVTAPKGCKLRAPELWTHTIELAYRKRTLVHGLTPASLTATLLRGPR